MILFYGIRISDYWFVDIAIWFFFISHVFESGSLSGFIYFVDSILYPEKYRYTTGFGSVIGSGSGSISVSVWSETTGSGTIPGDRIRKSNVY